VLDVQTERSDQYWSINIKKGLISLLQLKISGQSTISDTESYLSESSSFRPRNRFYDMVNPRRSSLGTSRPTNNIFKVMEVRVHSKAISRKHTKFRVLKLITMIQSRYVKHIRQK